MVAGDYMAMMEQRVSRLEGAFEHMATKADIARLEARLETSIANLKTDIVAVESRLLRWTVGTMGVGFGVTIAILKLT
jgi:hypothetical protein